MQKWNFFSTNEIKPLGWMKQQLKIQADGLNGNLDKVWRDVRDSAWIGGDAEGWERVPYWLDGFIPLAYLLEDSDMISRAEKYIDAILAKQEEDGWICPCPFDQRASYDTWAVLLISKVLTVYYECSGDERIPDALYRTIKNYYQLLSSGTCHLFDWGKARWFEGFIAIRFLYERYHEEWLLELARILKTQGTDYNKLTSLWERPKNKWTQETHIVNMAMMLKSECVSCDLLGEAYTNQAEALRTVLSRYHGTPVGLFTGDECLSGLSPIQGTELCSVVEQMYSYELLYAYTSDPKWAERLELLAFNALPATISDDMWTHQYDQMSNQISCIRFPGRSLFRTNGPDAHLFGLEPNFGCCTANFGQGWPKFALSAYMYQGNEIINAFPVPSSLQTDGIRIFLETNYPFENSFVYRIDSTKDFTFKVRIPSFAENLRINDTDAKADAADNCIRLSIKAGSEQTIRVSYETSPRLMDRPHQLKTAVCGSLVFSLPISYEKKMYEYETNKVERRFPYCDYEYIGLSEWSYGYADESLTKQYRTMGSVPFSSEKPPVVLKATVIPIDWGLEDGFDTVCAKTPANRVPVADAREVELYPYGCAKLRMTELPFIQ